MNNYMNSLATAGIAGLVLFAGNTASMAKIDAPVAQKVEYIKTFYHNYLTEKNVPLDKQGKHGLWAVFDDAVLEQFKNLKPGDPGILKTFDVAQINVGKDHLRIQYNPWSRFNVDSLDRIFTYNVFQDIGEPGLKKGTAPVVSGEKTITELARIEFKVSERPEGMYVLEGKQIEGAYHFISKGITIHMEPGGLAGSLQFLADGTPYSEIIDRDHKRPLSDDEIAFANKEYERVLDMVIETLIRRYGEQYAKKTW